MNTQQPKYQFVANLGDAAPLDHGGDFLFVDTTGVYPPRIIHFEEPDRRGKYQVSTLECPRLIYSKATGVLSDNYYHSDKPVWFADKLERVAGTVGMDADTLRDNLLSSDLIERAQAYISLTQYYGWYEFDQYPSVMTRTEIRRAFRGAFRN